MPTDAVKNRTFRDLLTGTVRFEIPFFQRGYAWDKKQWDQLFIDLQEEVIDDLAAGSPIEDLEHFFGPFVVLEKVGGATELKEFLVIDGQQRITTVYLLLSVVEAQIRAKKHLSSDAVDFSTKLRKYLVNDVEAADDYLKLKVFSSKGDRLPTYRAIFGSDANPTTPFLHTDLQLYVVGKNRIDEFKKYATRKIASTFTDVPALWQLAQVLLRSLTIVWIPLRQNDDPQAIFESLNDKGMPLSASELLCNYLFRPLIESKGNYEELHNTQWLAAIRLLENNEQFEDYLRTLFSIGESKMLGKHRKLYIHFKVKNRKLTAAAAKEHLSAIHEGAMLYRAIVDPVGHPHKDEAINHLLISIANTRMESSTPFVLDVLKTHTRGSLSSIQARSILRETLVLLVRRKMTEQPTTQYDVMFPPLLGKIVNEPNQILALHNQFKKHQVWISDQDFEEALVNKPTYRLRDLAFSRMILMEIDKGLQTHGQLPDYSTVNTIEHMLPQTLDDPWRKYLGSDATDEHLAALTHTLGNLCLLSGPANSAVGQDPFEAKKAVYSPVTALARELMTFAGVWNLEAIKNRSRTHAGEAVKIWNWATT
jgi:uncharacterized protein with ParB-like and HNH nuclease domain